MEENQSIPGNLGNQPNDGTAISKTSSPMNHPPVHLEDAPKTEMDVNERIYTPRPSPEYRNIYMNWQFVVFFIVRALFSWMPLTF
jgi:hypothetical protein